VRVFPNAIGKGDLADALARLVTHDGRLPASSPMGTGCV
jgi:hypothetical protein